MSLTTGRGPLSGWPSGRFSAPIPKGVWYVEPLRRRVRGIRAGAIVVDSERVLLVHRPGRPTCYAFPKDDVHLAAAEPETAAPGYVSVARQAVDEWYEEDEQVVGHPRNPYHRIDCLRTSRRLRVRVGDTVLVDTTDTVALYETALEPRLYVDRRHVRMDLLVPSATTTYCPYKGYASHWSAHVDDIVVEDAAWSYDDPLPESLRIAGLLSFYDDRVSVLHDLPPAVVLEAGHADD